MSTAERVLTIAALDAGLQEFQSDQTVQEVLTEGGTTDLKGWQREAMTARLVIVSTIERLSRTTGASLHAAIERFIYRYKSGGMAAHLMRAIEQANERRGERRKLSAPTLYRWLRDYEDKGASGLAPKAHETQGDIPLWAPLFLELYRSPSKPSISACVRMMGPDGPPEHHVRRFIQRYSNLDIHRGRMTGAELRAIRAYTKRDFSGLMPCDIIVADGHSFKGYVAHPAHGKRFLPEIETVIDVATRACIGWSCGLAESGQVVADALRHAATVNDNKPIGGLFAILYTDNGAGNRAKMNSDEVTGIIARLGGTLKFGIAGNPQGRGVIERLNQSLWVPAARKLIAYNGKDMDALAQRKRLKVIDRDLKEKGASKNLMSWPQFIEFLSAEVEAYNNRPHSSLPGGVSPQERWRQFESEGWRPDLLPPEEMQDLFRPQIECVTRRGLVTVFSNEYFNSELEHHHHERVYVNYDIHDPEAVWVRDKEQRLICIARWDGNKRHFMPMPFVEQARQKRAGRRLALIESKRAEIEAEARGVVEIKERIPEEAVKVSDESRVTSHEPRAASREPRERPFFGDDIERYDWHLQNGFLTEEDMLFREDFEQSGIYRMLYENSQ